MSDSSSNTISLRYASSIGLVSFATATGHAVNAISGMFKVTGRPLITWDHTIATASFASCIVGFHHPSVNCSPFDHHVAFSYVYLGYQARDKYFVDLHVAFFDRISHHSVMMVIPTLHDCSSTNLLFRIIHTCLVGFHKVAQPF